ncbi:hypothetical protein GGR33_003748 [Methylobacterium brachythecii]|uniref:Uncharacterized protein n=1 Tax=Methylobacterium brachythecii TaxID=1176177 RepID=A0A7W6AN12_9HYPH|nr:hypothetical protein [Methylobacterium brachythecii]
MWVCSSITDLVAWVSDHSRDFIGIEPRIGRGKSCIQCFRSQGAGTSDHSARTCSKCSRAGTACFRSCRFRFAPAIVTRRSPMIATASSFGPRLSIRPSSVSIASRRALSVSFISRSIDPISSPKVAGFETAHGILAHPKSTGATA